MRRSFDFEGDGLEENVERTMNGGAEEVAKALEVPTADEQMEVEETEESYQSQINAWKAIINSTKIRNAYCERSNDYDV